MGAQIIMEGQPTNNPAMTQFTKGRLSIPSCLGKEYIVYNKVINPGASIVAHPIFPGTLNRDGVDVLPIG